MGECPVVNTGEGSPIFWPKRASRIAYWPLEMSWILVGVHSWRFFILPGIVEVSRATRLPWCFDWFGRAWGWRSSPGMSKREGSTCSWTGRRTCQRIFSLFHTTEATRLSAASSMRRFLQKSLFFQQDIEIHTDSRTGRWLKHWPKRGADF